ncbi:hypothetical protein EJ06DRAFT_523360 [Trichodelitschia bisporula]|uniref:SRR1-like domain-containing protein n=1 Tax=Trichodelitschia bisporula TaxID=703511 RepID=A0A6G1HPX7_9PEZI|nr:hypothetical protein EJ06DRAFT_523360 [Trichodelitschia bisporula]
MPPRRQKRTTTSLGDGWSLVSSSGSAPPHARAQMPTQPQPDLPLTPHDLMLLCDDINTYIARLTALPPSPYPLPSGITSAACVGLGPFALPGPAYARGKAQIAAFLAFFRFKTGVVRRVAQDPAFRRADKDGLKALEIDVVDAPGITAEIGEGSVVYAPFLGWAVMLTQVLPRWWEAEGRGRPKAVCVVPCFDAVHLGEMCEWSWRCSSTKFKLLMTTDGLDR